MGSRGRAGPGEKRSWGRRSALGDVAGLAPRLGGLRRLCSPRGRRPTAWDPARPSLRIRDPGGTGRKRPSEPRPLGARPDEARVLLSKGLSPGLLSVAAAGQARRLRRVPPADFRGAGALRGEGRPGGRCHSGARAPRGRAWAMRAGAVPEVGRLGGLPAELMLEQEEEEPAAGGGKRRAVGERGTGPWRCPLCKPQGPGQGGQPLPRTGCVRTPSALPGAGPIRGHQRFVFRKRRTRTIQWAPGRQGGAGRAPGARVRPQASPQPALPRPQ